MALRVAIAATWLLAVTAAAQEPVAEFAALQGEWTVTGAEQGGQPFDAIKGGVLTIAGSGFALRTAVGNEFDGELTLDARTTPKQIDFLLSNGAVWQGIYTVTGDLFHLNYVERDDGVERPAVFATTAETLGTVIVLRKSGSGLP